MRILISDSIGEVSAEINESKNMKAVLVLAHGAGAGMNHRFMVQLSGELMQKGIGTIRYNFPYMENGKKRPDVPAVATKTVEMVLRRAYELFPTVPIFASGKSFGGRMSSQCLSKNSIDYVKGIIFYGFPLHPAGAPAVDRAEHLKQVKVPMLFLQGTRDALAELSLIQKVCSELDNASLILFEGADHSFKSGKKEFISELVIATEKWLAGL